MVDEQNPGTDDDLTSPSQNNVNNGGAVPSSPASDAVAQINADTHTRLDRALDSASQANRKMELYAKRLAGGAAVVVFLCVSIANGGGWSTFWSGGGFAGSHAIHYQTRGKYELCAGPNGCT